VTDDDLEQAELRLAAARMRFELATRRRHHDIAHEAARVITITTEQIREARRARREEALNR
jgi:hypothetical protein